MLRRAFEQLGHPVKTLTRVAFGSIVLNDLKAGEWRKLSITQLQRLKQELVLYQKRARKAARKAKGEEVDSEAKGKGVRARGQKKAKAAGTPSAVDGVDFDPEIESFWDAVLEEGDEDGDIL